MPIYLSASSINDFVRCPQKVLYRFKKTVPAEVSKDMVAGEVIHYVIEKGWNNREKAKSILDNEVKVRDLRKADATNLSFMLDIFFLNFAGLLGEKDLIEYNFKIPLYDDVFIVGKIDRIYRGNVLDWKSSAKLPSRLDNDIQCIIYDWAFKRIFGNHPASLCVAGLSTGQLIPFVRNDFYVREVFEKIIPRMIKAVRHDEYERLGMFNHSCFRCPWKTGCLQGSRGEERNVLDNSILAE